MGVYICVCVFRGLAEAQELMRAIQDACVRQGAGSNGVSVSGQAGRGAARRWAVCGRPPALIYGGVSSSGRGLNPQISAPLNHSSPECVCEGRGGFGG